jgi:large subunit ribosomal protein L13
MDLVFSPVHLRLRGEDVSVGRLLVLRMDLADFFYRWMMVVPRSGFTSEESNSQLIWRATGLWHCTLQYTPPLPEFYRGASLQLRRRPPSGNPDHSIDSLPGIDYAAGLLCISAPIKGVCNYGQTTVFAPVSLLQTGVALQRFALSLSLLAFANRVKRFFFGSADSQWAKERWFMLALGKTSMVRKEDVYDRDWYIVDADNQVVGRLATQIATVLMGKHRPEYTPHVDGGDYVIVVNSERVRFSGSSMQHARVPYLTTKMAKKQYDHYTGFPGGRRVQSAVEVWEKRPDRLLHEAVRRMLPKNKLGRHMLAKLRIFTGTEHSHQAQQPKPFPAHLMPRPKAKK